MLAFIELPGCQRQLLPYSCHSGGKRTRNEETPGFVVRVQDSPKMPLVGMEFWTKVRINKKTSDAQITCRILFCKSITYTSRKLFAHFHADATHTGVEPFEYSNELLLVQNAIDNAIDN